MILRKLHHNGESEEEMNPSLDEAMALFEGTEWEIERMLEMELRDKGKKVSAPGMSFSTLRRELVSVFPDVEGLKICFEFPGSGKFLGLFPRGKQSQRLFVIEFPKARLREVVSALYDGKSAKIQRLLRQHGKKVRQF